MDRKEDEMYRQLKEDYQKSIPNKLSHMKTLIEKVKQDPSNKDLLQELYFAIHKLTGSAGTYGYLEVSRHSRIFEQEVKKEDLSRSEEHLSNIQKAFLGEGKLLQKIKAKEAIIGVVGMGYIGLSLLKEFAEEGFSVIGYDIDAKKVKMIQEGKSFYNFISVQQLNSFSCSNDPSILDRADVLMICVPTSLNKQHLPDFSCLKKAFQTVQKHLRKDQLIILQSTTSPGTTEEELLPLLLETGLKVGQEFFLGYVPECVDPGNTQFTSSDIPKIISGITPACLEMVQTLYQQTKCKTILCSSPKIAEAAKIVQNTYRLVNISLVNEMGAAILRRRFFIEPRWLSKGRLF